MKPYRITIFVEGTEDGPDNWDHQACAILAYFADEQTAMDYARRLLTEVPTEYNSELQDKYGEW